MKETAYEHLAGNTHFTVTAAERWSIGMLRRLHEKFPDEVTIVAENEDGSIVGHVPVEWMRIRAKKRVTMTEEQRQAMSERMRKMRAARVSPEEGDPDEDEAENEADEILEEELLEEEDDD